MVAESESRPRSKPGPKPSGVSTVKFEIRLRPEAARFLESVATDAGKTQADIVWEGIRLLAESGRFGKGVKVPLRV